MDRPGGPLDLDALIAVGRHKTRQARMKDRLRAFAAGSERYLMPIARVKAALSKGRPKGAEWSEEIVERRRRERR